MAMMNPKLREENEKEEADMELIQKLMEMVSDKNNVTRAIVGMFMDDAPATQLPGIVEAAIKNVVDTALFWGVKFYKTTKSASHVVGHVFGKMNMGGSKLEDKMCCSKNWTASCEYLSTRTNELQQQCI